VDKNEMKELAYQRAKERLQGDLREDDRERLCRQIAERVIEDNEPIYVTAQELDNVMARVDAKTDERLEALADPDKTPLSSLDQPALVTPEGLDRLGRPIIPDWERLSGVRRDPARYIEHLEDLVEYLIGTRRHLSSRVEQLELELQRFHAAKPKE